MAATTIVRYGYRDTSSSAGRPERVELHVLDVLEVRCWINSYGNPSYCYRLRDGHTLYLVDAYDGMNDLRDVGCEVVRRRADLFGGWLR